jgi:hypothetical protein
MIDDKKFRHVKLLQKSLCPVSRQAHSHGFTTSHRDSHGGAYEGQNMKHFMHHRLEANLEGFLSFNVQSANGGVANDWTKRGTVLGKNTAQHPATWMLAKSKIEKAKKKKHTSRSVKDYLIV